jgi:hypothetical protein
MELQEFLNQLQDEVHQEIDVRIKSNEGGFPFPELVFSEKVMEHMSEIGMTFDPEICHYSGKVGNANLRLTGFSLSDDMEQLDLFVSLYSDTREIQQISETETKTAAEQCLRFLTKCADGQLAATMHESHDAYAFALTIEQCYSSLDQIRIYVLSDRVAKSKNFKSREVGGKTVKLEVMDIERLFRHWSEGKPRDELIVNFEDVSGTALPCVYVPGQIDAYDYALTVINGEALRFIYEKYGPRLLEANVRSFLSSTGKINRGIRDTLRGDPEKFMAYNNGIVLVADEIMLGKTSDGGPGIIGLKGMQIVNGGQTTASIYFSKKKFPEINLANVRIPAKIIILKSTSPEDEESLVADISRYANSQNSVKQSDLAANKPFHVEIEKLASSTYCPNGIGRWFYERAAGSYNTLLTREGNTPAKLKALKTDVIPSSRKITKTDLAKYMLTWDRRPDLVSLGSQKNFEKFMDYINTGLDGNPLPMPTVSDFKNMVAKAIIYKKTSGLVRPLFPAFQGNVATYLVSMLSEFYGNKFNFDKVWANQDISVELRNQLKIWSGEVNEVLHKSSGGRMISEWAKKPECWDAVKVAKFSPAADNIPELII